MLKRFQRLLKNGFFLATLALSFISCNDNFGGVGDTPDASKSSISLSASTTVQNTAIVATVTLRDIDNLPVPGVTPVLSISPSGATYSCSETASNGVAACSIVSSTATTYTVALSAPVSRSAGSFIVYQKPGSMSFSTQPAGVVSDVVFASNVAVSILDIYGAAVTSVAASTVVTLTISGTDSTAVMTLNGTACASSGCTAAIAAGAATFTNLRINKAGIYTLTATVSGVTATSSSFAVTHGAASQIAFSTQPSSSTNINRVLAQMPVVQVQDAAGNVVSGHASDSSVAVSMTVLNCAGATLIGDSAVATAGVADFSNSGIRFSDAATETGCQLRASATITAGAVTATSNTFSITVAGANAALDIDDANLSTTAAANVPFTNQPKVYIVDASGYINTNDYTTTVTISKGAGSTGSGNLNGTVTGTAVRGVVTFTDLYFDLAGTYYLTATSGSLTPAVSAPMTVSSLGSAASLSISTQPVDSAVSTALQPGSVVVKILDSNGHLVNTSTATVTATLATGTGTLGGTTSVAAVAGVATFSNLTISAVGGGKSITFASSGLTSTTSSTFSVYNVGTARKLRFRTEPTQSSTNNVAFATQPVVEVVDEHGLVVTTDTSTITIACVYADAGCAAVNNDNVAAVAGVATFLTTDYSAADTNVVLQATGGGYTPATTKPNLRVQ